MERFQKRFKKMDYYHIFITIFMIISGSVIIIRSSGKEWFLNSVIIGGGIFVFGIYRAKLVLKYIKEMRNVS